DNTVICPTCHTSVKLGKVGMSNYTKRHVGTEKCAQNLKKWKAQQVVEKSKARAATMFAPRPKLVPPRVHSPELPQSGPSSSTPTSGLTHELPRASAVAGDAHGLAILATFRGRISALPETVPLANESHPFAGYSGRVQVILEDGQDAWEVFDGPLNTQLQQPPEHLRSLVQRGPLGLMALHNLLLCLVTEHGVLGACFELKLERLLHAIDEVSPPILEDAALPPALAMPIDVDVLPDEPPMVQPVSAQHFPCAGIPFEPKPGQTVHRGYPFGVHDETGDGWDYSVCRGVMKLYAPTCRPVESESTRCAACAALMDNPNLLGVFERRDHGVKPSTPFTYHSVGGLVTILRRRVGEVRALKLMRTNDIRKLERSTATLSLYKQFVMAIGSGEVKRVDRVVKAGLKRHAGIKALFVMLNRAAQQVYRPVGYSEEDMLAGLLTMRMCGERLVGILHRSGLGIPSVSTLRRHTLIASLLTSPGRPTPAEIEYNVQSCFEEVEEVLKTRKVVHQVLQLDELKVEPRPRWDDKSDMIIGICREHGHRVSLKFTSHREVDELMAALRAGKVHMAVEATVGAIAPLCAETRLYSARPILISGSCKKETADEHATVIQTALDASRKTCLRTVCIASDGESHRGAALVRLTFTRMLSPDSNIYDLLHALEFMNFAVGPDDITADKDYKHVFKRLRNLLLRARGLHLHGVHIRTGDFRVHLGSRDVPLPRINNLLKPDDKQDVELAYQLLSEVWKLPPAEEVLPPRNPRFRDVRSALRTLGALFRHILLPYLCVDLSLSEQLEHLSAAAHLLLALVRDENAGAAFMPTQLYIDIMIMIKNVYFCVAKAQVDDPEGSFWIILLGTDRLEELFGILRTMVGNDANVDALQLGLRLTGTAEVSTILAKVPHWDRGPRRLRLPALDKDSLEVHKHVDHIKPSSWRGDVRTSQVNLQTCWQRGRRMIEVEFPSLAAVLDRATAENRASPLDILRPFGDDIVGAERHADDFDDTAEDYVAPDAADDAESRTECALEPDLEDAAAEESPAGKHDPCFELNGEKFYKSRYLNLSFRDIHEPQPSSRDRMRRIAGVPRFGNQTSAWSGASTQIEISLDAVHESDIAVSFQLLYLRPATVVDDPKLKHDWCWSKGRGPTYTVPGRLIECINADLSVQGLDDQRLLFESSVIMALGASIYGRLGRGDVTLVPKVTATCDRALFPYREATGKACFICEDEEPGENGVPKIGCCPLCSPPVKLPTEIQKLLAHNAAHILFDSSVRATDEPCGLCMRPAGIDYKKSTCAIGKFKMRYAVAAASSESSPASNVPISCPWCRPEAPAVWKYNLLTHARRAHPDRQISDIEPLAATSATERQLLKAIWSARHLVKKTRRSRKSAPALTLSEAHSTRNAFMYAPNPPSFVVSC
ncbi:hypothetical protein AURDEDRAFT_70847, partial [Auricularia subglabra TFB-10046 SS5]